MEKGVLGHSYVEFYDVYGFMPIKWRLLLVLFLVF